MHAVVEGASGGVLWTSLAVRPLRAAPAVSGVAPVWRSASRCGGACQARDRDPRCRALEWTSILHGRKLMAPWRPGRSAPRQRAGSAIDVCQ